MFGGTDGPTTFNCLQYDSDEFLVAGSTEASSITGNSEETPIFMAIDDVSGTIVNSAFWDPTHFSSIASCASDTTKMVMFVDNPDHMYVLITENRGSSWEFNEIKDGSSNSFGFTPASVPGLIYNNNANFMGY
jgi:hypothetical protein